MRYFHLQALYLRVFRGSQSCFLPPDGDGSLDGTTKTSDMPMIFSPGGQDSMVRNWIPGLGGEKRFFSFPKVANLYVQCENLSGCILVLRQILTPAKFNRHSP